MKPAHIAIAIAALIAMLVSVLALERSRSGLDITALEVGSTPVTRYQLLGATGPVVVVAHGFAGSRQIMQAYSLNLARTGYRVLAFDFEGHGSNPRPMSGDVSSIDGTTALLVAETRRVVAAARALPGNQPVSLLGHSMATDILVRTALAERADGQPVAAVVAISMFSEAVTATMPERLLVISGQLESRLRQAALDAVRLVEADAEEGDLVTFGSVAREALVAPWVEHVGVLFSPTAVRAAIGWLDDTYERESDTQVVSMGLWILLLLAGTVAIIYPLAALLPEREPAPDLSIRRFLFAVTLPAVAAPVLVAPLYSNFLPVLVADYLVMHLAVYGILQLWLSGQVREIVKPISWGAVALLAFWGIAVFGLALDRYAASFWPNSERIVLIALLALGTVPFMLADSMVTAAGRGALWRRIAARVALLSSLIAGALIDPENLAFVLIVLPVFVLFFFVHGLMGRWVGRRCGAAAAGLGLGLCLAWVLGVSFPLFAGG
ncbi:MAG: alpha/beta fold hydrolase [Roseitalea porphyridii]|uniref:alpha/beta hydrolase n=1 Tax=Roseitalea porphyridii TaxID=1852022 RepID=UPI0032ED20ED